MARMSIGTNGADEDASTTTSAFDSRASAVIFVRSGRVPTTPDAAVTATTLVRWEISDSYCQAGSSHVSMSISAQRTVAPARCATPSHGAMFCWWSSRDTTTSSPMTQPLPIASASRCSSTAGFGPSTTPAGSQPTRSATARRAASTIASARCEAGNTPPGPETGARSAVDTAVATCSGTCIPAGASR